MRLPISSRTYIRVAQSIDAANTERNHSLESATSTILEKFEELKHELHTVKRALYETGTCN